MAVTKLVDLLDPLIIGRFIDKALIKKLVFGRLAEISYEMSGQPGMTKKVPTWGFIGAATEVGEGEEITTSKLSQSSFVVTIKKIGKAVELTDEAIVGGWEEPVNQTVIQIAAALADKIEDDFVVAIRALTPSTVEMDEGYHWILDAQVAFGEDFSEENFLFISPERRAVILKSADFVAIQQGQAIVTGHVGTIFGTNIVITGRLTKDESVMLRRGGLGMEIKRDYNFEVERDVKHRQHYLSADQMYINYVRDSAKVVFINKVKVTP